MAAFFSGGSLAPPDAPSAPPAELLTAQTVVGAILLASAAPTPEAAVDKQRLILTLGLTVARGLNSWSG